MVHPEIQKLVKEVFSFFDKEEGERAEKYPEAYLVSLLEEIREELPEVSATLYSAVEISGFGSDTERFRLALARVKSVEKTTHPKTGKKTLRHQRLAKVGA